MAHAISVPGGILERFEPLSATHPLSPEPPQSPPKRTLWQRFKRWCAHHIFPAACGSRNHQGRRLRKAPPPGHPSHSATSLRQHHETDHQLELDELARVSETAGLRSRASSKRSSIFGLSTVLNTFKYDVELSFLTPLESQVHQRLMQVTGAGRLRKGQTDNLHILVLPDEDSAKALVAIRRTTQQFPESQKETLCHDLDNLLTKEQRAVLRRALFLKVEIHGEGIERRIPTPISAYQEREPVIRPSSAKQVRITEPPRPLFSRVGDGNHRFSRGSGYTSKKSSFSEDLGGIMVKTDIKMHHGAMIAPRERRAPDFDVPGQWR